MQVPDGAAVAVSRVRTLATLLRSVKLRYRPVFLLLFSPTIIRGVFTAFLGRFASLPDEVLKSEFILPQFRVVFRCKCGLEFLARVSDISFFMQPEFEPKTSELVYPMIRRDDTVVDVGAHIGIHTVHYAKRARLVVALEPEPSNASLLSHNVSLNSLDNVLLLPLAATAAKGAFSLGLDENSAFHSIVPAATQRIKHVKEIQGDRLDSILGRLGIGHVRLLKIDVERGEEEVIKGMGSYCNPDMTEIVQVEVWPENEASVGGLMERYPRVIDLKENFNHVYLA